MKGNGSCFEEYMRKRDGTDVQRKKTGKICPECRQNIYESKKRDYSGDEGIKRALSDCLKSGKTRYGPKIAEIISRLDGADKPRRFPLKVKELFEKVSGEFNFTIAKDNL